MNILFEGFGLLQFGFTKRFGMTRAGGHPYLRNPLPPYLPEPDPPPVEVAPRPVCGVKVSRWPSQAV